MIKSLAILVSTLLTTFVSSTSANSLYEEGKFFYPNGLTKALILSYDDGLDQDRRLIEVFNKYNLKGTFHLNSGKFGQTAEWLEERVGKAGTYVKSEEVRELYKGHEISAHTVNHPFLLKEKRSFVLGEINHDIASLEGHTDYPIVSFAYPFGQYDKKLLKTLESTPIIAARTVEDTHDFQLPDNMLTWHPSSHHTTALKSLDNFLLSAFERPSLYLMWGHSWEFDYKRKDNSWHLIELICRRISQHKDIWHVGMGELARYLDAVRSLKKNKDEWVNPTNTTVWIELDGKAVEIPPQ